MPSTNWKTDNHKFVGKAFDFSYAERLNKLSPIMSEVTTRSVDYEIEGTGGYGELQQYDGTNLNHGKMSRGFKTIVRPQEFSKSIPVGYKQAKIDKRGETKKVGTRLGASAAATVYLHMLRCFARAWAPTYLGGDGKPWAAADHPVASKGSNERKFIVDEEAGTYSNVMSSAFSVSAITAAQTMANRLITPDGLPLLAEFDTVLISPELEPKAKRFFGESSRLMPLRDPENDHNAANPIYGMKYIVIGGGMDGFRGEQWAVCDRKMLREVLNLIYITKPCVMQSELDNPLIDMYTAYVDFGVGWGDARPIIFSRV